jgi:hypothetical protein
MSAMHDALVQYVALRRALGTQLQEPAMTLVKFVDFLERQGAEFITSELALRWAMEPKLVQRATWARRLGAGSRHRRCGSAERYSCGSRIKVREVPLRSSR